jgi:hypothetical protein
MKLAARKNATVDEQRRYQRQYERDRSPAMRLAFPELALLNVELTFADRNGTGPKEPVPSSQSHAFYPPARAFFRFTCPCADCNGEFDLSANVAQLAAAGGRGIRTARACADRAVFSLQFTAGPHPYLGAAARNRAAAQRGAPPGRRDRGQHRTDRSAGARGAGTARCRSRRSGIGHAGRGSQPRLNPLARN